MSARVTRKRSRAQEDEQALPPAKREPGLDDPENAHSVVRQQVVDGQVFKRDEEFWFEDGTVILIAACDVEFRFYKGLLASISPVFKDLFSDCQVVRNVRIDQKQTYSCPVVHVSDSPEDLRHVLRTCLCPSSRPVRLYEEREPSYQTISSAIRLGHKYKIAEIYSQSMQYLKNYFVTTFNRWLYTFRLSPPPGWKELDAIGVINIARLTGELSLLSSAFVACIRAKSTGTNGIVHGNSQEDGSTEHLSPDDLAVCLNGKTSLRMATVAAVLRTFEPTVSPECQRPPCKEVFREVLLNLGGKLNLLLDGDPFAPYWKFWTPQVGLCQPCIVMLFERSRKERKAVWNRLPELLGIDVPGWGQDPRAAPPPS